MIETYAARATGRQEEALELFGHLWGDRMICPQEAPDMDRLGRLLGEIAADGQEVAESQRVGRRVETMGISAWLDSAEGRRIRDWLRLQEQREAQQKARTPARTGVSR